VTDELVLGCDVGSQGTNVAAYSGGGELVASAYEPYDVSFPAPSWAEQDPALWLVALEGAVKRVLDEPGVEPSAVKGMSFGSQLDGVVAVDGQGRALRPALIWMDRRAEEQARRLAERIEPRDFYGLSGTNLDSSHGVFKILWIRDTEPDRFADAARFHLPGSFVLEQVTGVGVVDYSNGSSFALLDPRERAWSAPLVELCDLDESLLPPVRAATEAVGTITRAFAEATELDRGTVVSVGCGDEMAATLGAGVYEPGEVCDVVGTAEPVCAASDRPREDETMLVECHPHADPAAWLLENPGFVSGGNLRWFRDQLAPLEVEAERNGGSDAYDALVALAGRVPAGAEGLVFLPCMQGAMAPEWNGAARGVFHGLTLAHTRAHLFRAVLEGSAFALRDILEAMREASLETRRLTIVGGGAKGRLWRQIKADVTGLPVRVPANVETTATGAAMLAAVGAGLHASVGDAAELFVRYEPAEIEPEPEARELYERAYELYREVYFALKPVFASAPPA
jgi:xylulokinase